jgi:hypothetical protein
MILVAAAPKPPLAELAIATGKGGRFRHFPAILQRVISADEGLSRSGKGAGYAVRVSPYAVARLAQL